MIEIEEEWDSLLGVNVFLSGRNAKANLGNEIFFYGLTHKNIFIIY